MAESTLRNERTVARALGGCVFGVGAILVPIDAMAIMTAWIDNRWFDDRFGGALSIQFSNVFFPVVLAAATFLFLFAGRRLWRFHHDAPRTARWAGIVLLFLFPVGTALGLAMLWLLRRGGPVLAAFPAPPRSEPPEPPQL